MPYHKHTETQFKQAVKESFSIAQVLKKLNLVGAGGNYKTFHSYVEKYKIDTSHFTGQTWNKGMSFKPKRPIEDYLNNIYPIGSHPLRLRLIKESIKEAKCEDCNNTLWNNKPISLELEHIDGNHKNNNLSNLKILCPNCHAQTSTYRGKNKKSIKQVINIVAHNELTNTIEIINKKTNKCSCGKLISNLAKSCKSCAGFIKNKTKIFWPQDNELLNRLKLSSYLQVSKELGVSDNAIRKRLKKRKLL